MGFIQNVNIPKLHQIAGGRAAMYSFWAADLALSHDAVTKPII